MKRLALCTTAFISMSGHAYAVTPITDEASISKMLGHLVNSPIRLEPSIDADFTIPLDTFSAVGEPGEVYETYSGVTTKVAAAYYKSEPMVEVVPAYGGAIYPESEPIIEAAPVYAESVYYDPAPIEAMPVMATSVAQPYQIQEQPYTPPIMELSATPTELHDLVTKPDVATAINFRGSERISVITMGRPDQFFVDTPDNHKTISIRPKSASSRSNLTVVTNKDIYHFDVRAVGGDEKAHYGVVMDDKDAAEKAELNSLGDITDLNFSYTYRGSDELRPLRMFDDGKHTYIQLPDHVSLPAIFAVAGDGSESIVNHHTKGRYVVVNTLERQFTLRDGNTVTCIFNKAYPSPVYSDAAPMKEGA